MENLLDQLNDSQREAVTWCDGAQLVIAGAGSGKTRVLTYKIAYLLQAKQLAPWQILALTFTNKAAREMKERIARLVGQERARYLQMGTFHSVFARILRAEAQAIGFQPSFTIYDQTDARSLVKNIIREMQLDDKQYKPAAVADHISMAKNHLVGPDAYARCALYDQRRPKEADIYAAYAQRCRQANAMDFDDLLLMTFRLFDEHDDVRRRYVEKFHYVLVDEYQDTNVAQQRIMLQLTRERQRVCVVGDDAQSIYSFRGANIDNILNFRQSYTDARLFKLERNYRSTQLIVEAANSLIRKNERQIPKDVYSEGDHGERLQLKPAMSDREEAIIVCRDIERIKRQEHGQYSDFAILYRTNAQSRAFEEQMRKDGIPYRIYGGLSFYQRKEIKDVIAYFRLVCNPDDEEALRRIINYPARGIGDTTVGRITQAATSRGVSLWTVVSQPVMFGLDVARATAAKLEAFRQTVEQWRTQLPTTDAYELGSAIIEQSGVARDIYASRNPDDVARQENLQEFLAGMQDFVESRREEGQGDQVALTDFLQEVALLTDLDSDGDGDEHRVSLMTIHAAKGLEFPTVFIVGLEENIFPSPMSTDSLRALEEERRLLYVAITRAERHCILTCAENRFRYGRMEFDTPSRFIRDIDPRLIDVSGGSTKLRDESLELRDFRELREKPSKSLSTLNSQPSTLRSHTQNPRPVASQFRADPLPRAVPHRPEEPPVDPFSPAFKRLLSVGGGRKLLSTENTEDTKYKRRDSVSSVSSVDGTLPNGLREGATIEHQRFGVGTVVRLEGTGENAKATVDFRNAGTKQLLLKFARIKVL